MNRIIFPEEIQEKWPEVVYEESQIDQLCQLTKNKETMKRILEYWESENKICFPGPPKPMSVIDLSLIDRDDFHEPIWWGRERFARKDKARFGWYLMSLNLSKKMSWKETLGALPYQKRVPNISELIWFSDLCRKTRHVKVFNEALRSSSRKNGFHVCLDNTKERAELFLCSGKEIFSSVHIEEVQIVL